MKNKVGKPLKFKTVKELQEKIDSYFSDCNKKDLHPTVCGLAVYLDTDRSTLIDYADREKYSNTIKKAKQIIEAHAEQLLYRNGTVTGVIFNLKNNFGWRDQSEVKNTGNPTVVIEKELSDKYAPRSPKDNSKG